MQQHGNNILPADPLPPDPGVGSKGKNLTFSEHGHAAFEIKVNHKCSNMVANILPADPSQTLGVGSKGLFFRTWSCAYQVKENGASSTYSLTHTLNLWVGFHGKKSQNVIILHIKRGKKYGPT